MPDAHNELDDYPYRPAKPGYWRGDETGYDEYHRQLYRLTSDQNGFTRWKIRSTGMNVARQLAGARNRGRAVWVREHGSQESAWPLPHPPAVLWRPVVAYAACLRCWWLDEGNADLGAAASAARRHAAEFIEPGSPALGMLLAPLRVWKHPGTGGERAPRTAG